MFRYLIIFVLLVEVVVIMIKVLAVVLVEY